MSTFDRDIIWIPFVADQALAFIERGGKKSTGKVVPIIHSTSAPARHMSRCGSGSTKNMKGTPTLTVNFTQRLAQKVHGMNSV